MKISSLLSLALLLTGIAAAGVTSVRRHPCLLMSPQEVLQLRVEKEKFPLFANAYHEARNVVGEALRKPMDVPTPKDAAGYTHERHKQNYREMQMAGMLFQLTADERYARFVRDMLKQYAQMYPTLGRHPAAIGNGGGRLFWQTLNESVWLVNTAIAYDLIYEWLLPADRAIIERDVLRPMAEFFITDCASTVDRIHNHATWMTAGIGMLGFVLEDARYVEIALKGTKRDGASGFLKQLDELYSPDGYYSEGPYYSRYAIYPFYVFAEAIERNQPDEKIFARKNGVLGKALHAIIQLSTDAGNIIQVNDAMEKSVKAQELILACDYAYHRYSGQENLLDLAAFQNSVTLDPAGFGVARALAGHTAAPYPRRSIELSDGPKGADGGIGVLRSASDGVSTMAVLKYTAQGGGHGHFDRLNLLFFDQGEDVLTDYGAARFVNVEPKFGGRYLKENETWAKQTIAHNALVIDERSHFDANLKKGEANPGRRRFFSTTDPACQVMSASMKDNDRRVAVERTVAVVTDSALTAPVLLDVIRVDADKQHTYDLPYHYAGQLMSTSFPYAAFDSVQRPMGRSNGYQHMWLTAKGKSDASHVVTWLLKGRYYSIATAAYAGAEILLGRSGASDPEVNLRSEPVIVIRRRGAATVFASMIQPHGSFEPTNEVSTGYRAPFQNVRVLASTPEATVVECVSESGMRWQFAVAHGEPDEAAVHSISIGSTTVTWKGNYSFEKLSGR